MALNSPANQSLETAHLRYRYPASNGPQFLCANCCNSLNTKQISPVFPLAECVVFSYFSHVMGIEKTGAQTRGIDSDATPLGGQILRVMSRFGYRKDFLGWRVVSSWEEIVGERIAKMSSATRYSDKALYVKVANPLLRQNLSMEVDLLLSEIRKSVGSGIVEKIHFH
jgi:Dna[CI] antecedent, DciA